MPEPLASINGRDLPVSEAAIAITDLGFVQGATVTEMIRTFGHRSYRLADHLDRLEQSLRLADFPNPPRRDELAETANRLVTNNAQLIPEHHDLGINISITAGHNPAYFPPSERPRATQPTVCVHTWPLPFELWADAYESGQHLVVSDVLALPRQCLDPRIKTRSRMHWYLADHQVRRDHPDARAVLVDETGSLTETSTANVFIVRGQEILTPPDETVLGGVSRATLGELAAQLGYRFIKAGITPQEMADADEAFTSSTPYCILPVTRFNARPVGTGQPGPAFAALIAAWRDLVGVDIMAQARDAARERLRDSDNPDSPPAHS